MELLSILWYNINIMKMIKQKRRRIGSEKQNIRLWYNYLQMALELKLKINKEYYRKWHISTISAGMRFDSWYKEHKHLFVINKKISLEIASTLTYKDAVAKAKELLKGKTDKQTDFELSSTRFRYLEIDDYLKCYKLKRKDKRLFYIGTMLDEEYQKKQEQYKNSKKLLQRKLLQKKFEDMQNNIENVISIVSRKIKKADKIIKNTAKGQFPGKY